MASLATAQHLDERVLVAAAREVARAVAEEACGARGAPAEAPGAGGGGGADGGGSFAGGADAGGGPAGGGARGGMGREELGFGDLAGALWALATLLPFYGGPCPEPWVIHGSSGSGSGSGTAESASSGAPAAPDCIAALLALAVGRAVQEAGRAPRGQALARLVWAAAVLGCREERLYSCVLPAAAATALPAEAGHAPREGPAPAAEEEEEEARGGEAGGGGASPAVHPGGVGVGPGRAGRAWEEGSTASMLMQALLLGCANRGVPLHGPAGGGAAAALALAGPGLPADAAGRLSRAWAARAAWSKPSGTQVLVARVGAERERVRKVGGGWPPSTSACCLWGLCRCARGARPARLCLSTSPALRAALACRRWSGWGRSRGSSTPWPGGS
jgi:hypothetical protein